MKRILKETLDFDIELVCESECVGVFSQCTCSLSRMQFLPAFLIGLRLGLDCLLGEVHCEGFTNTLPFRLRSVTIKFCGPTQFQRSIYFPRPTILREGVTVEQIDTIRFANPNMVLLISKRLPTWWK